MDARGPKVKDETKNQQAVDALVLAIQEKLGVDIEIKLEPYSEMIIAGKKDQGTLVVYVPPAGKGDVHYQTWYSAGKLTGKPESKG